MRKKMKVHKTVGYEILFRISTKCGRVYGAKDGMVRIVSPKWADVDCKRCLKKRAKA